METALIEAAWKSVAIALIGLVLDRMLRGAPATTRHRALIGVFATLALLPILSLALLNLPTPPWTPLPVVAPRKPSAGTPRLATPLRRLSAPFLARKATPTIPFTPIVPTHSFPWRMVLLGIWATLSAAAFLQLATGLSIARRLVRSATPADAAMVTLAHDAARAMNLRSLPAVRLSDSTTTPLVFGRRHPIILLPSSASEWDADRLRAVLLHETAHIARNDFRTQLLVQCVCAFYAANPLVWRLAVRLREAAEVACDARVLDAGMAPSAYATHLFAIAQQATGRTYPLLPAMARPDTSEPLEGRIQMILDSDSPRRLSRRRVLFLATATVLTLTPALALRLTARAEERIIPPHSLAPTTDASAFLRWSMDRYASLHTFQAKGTWILQTGGISESQARHDDRTIVYAAPNRFRITTTAYDRLSHIYISDGKQMVIHKEGYNQASESFPAPASLADADKNNMSHPHFGGSMLYRFFGGGARLPYLLGADTLALVDKTGDNKKASPFINEWASRTRAQLSGPAPHFGPDVIVDGEPCKTVIFNGGMYANERRALISLRDGLVRRLEYYASARKLSAQDLAMMGERKPKDGMLPGSITTEVYTDIVVDGPVAANAFDIHRASIR